MNTRLRFPIWWVESEFTKLYIPSIAARQTQPTKSGASILTLTVCGLSEYGLTRETRGKSESLIIDIKPAPEVTRAKKG